MIFMKNYQISCFACKFHVGYLLPIFCYSQGLMYTAKKSFCTTNIVIIIHIHNDHIINFLCIFWFPHYIVLFRQSDKIRNLYFSTTKRYSIL